MTHVFDHQDEVTEKIKNLITCLFFEDEFLNATNAFRDKFLVLQFAMGNDTLAWKFLEI